MKIGRDVWGSDYVLVGGQILHEENFTMQAVVDDDIKMLVTSRLGTTLFGLNILRRWDGDKFYYVIEINKEVGKLVHKPEIHIVSK